MGQEEIKGVKRGVRLEVGGWRGCTGSSKREARRNVGWPYTEHGERARKQQQSGNLKSNI